MSDEFSLVATRKRRANAGSRLKQLIQLEEQHSEVQSSFPMITEDDENVNLLFQEDEEDEEFIEEERSDDEFANLKGIDESEGEEGEEVEGEGEGKENEGEEGEEPKGSVDADDVLSDSDISASDSDESEGEKELQKQERKRKRTKTVVPAIKAREKVEKPVVKKVLVSSDTLLLSARRSSSRTSAVESKQALVQKLKESEERRAKFSPVPRVKHVALTQEERLEEAVETERKNIISLNQFQQQEIVKKEHQKKLLHSRRQKLKNVVRLVSTETYVYPLDEMNRAQRNYDNDRKRRKGGRKKKQDELEFSLIPGKVDTELPYAKEEAKLKREAEEEEAKLKRDAEAEEVRLQELRDAENKEAARLNEQREVESTQDGVEAMEGIIPDSAVEENPTDVVEPENEPNQAIDGESEVVPESENNLVEDATSTLEVASDKETPELNLDAKDVPTGSADLLDIENNEDKQNDENDKSTSVDNEETANDDNDKSTSVDNEDKTNEENHKSTSMEVGNQDTTNHDENGKSTSVEDDPMEGVIDSKDSEEKTINESVELDILPADGVDIKAEIENIDEVTQSTEPIIKEETVPEDSRKRVKFSDEVESSIVPSREMTPEVKHGDDEEMFEGPPQKIARQTIYLVDFEDNARNHRLSENNIKSILFGSQALLPASRRFKDLKTIARIGAVDNPYASVKQEDTLFQSITLLTEESEMFDELKRLPRLGIKQEIVEEVEENVEQKATAISIKTEAPTGLSLPNNNKKTCLISGTEVKYFDPYTGIPYSSVDTYKFIKTIEQGQIPWYSFTGDTNDTGVVEMYLGSREGNRHAKGVPEGFDG